MGDTMQKKLTVLILSFVMLFNMQICAGALSVSAQSAVLIEASTGKILYENNAYAKMPMASTTKIMTAVTVLENTVLTDTVTVSAQAAATEGSSMYLKSGEKITVLELLYGLMLSSGNDAANALAEYVGDSRENFAVLMNQTADKIGMARKEIAALNKLVTYAEKAVDCDLSSEVAVVRHFLADYIKAIANF